MNNDKYSGVTGPIILLYSMVLSLVLLTARMFGVISIDWIWVAAIPLLAWIGLHILNILLIVLITVFGLFLEGR